MTTIYREVVIRTEEEADALPMGTVAFLDEPAPGSSARYTTTRRPGGWTDTLSEFPSRHLGHDELIGWTALTPVEVDHVRAEFNGVSFRAERRAFYPFDAYYSHNGG